MQTTAAEAFALEVLGWLASDPERIGAFLGWSGEAPGNLARRATDPAFLLAVLDFLMLDDAMVIQASADLGVDPTFPGRARQALPGGADMHWT